jgi:hypothetical protein
MHTLILPYSYPTLLLSYPTLILLSSSTLIYSHPNRLQIDPTDRSGAHSTGCGSPGAEGQGTTKSGKMPIEELHDALKVCPLTIPLTSPLTIPLTIPHSLSHSLSHLRVFRTLVNGAWMYTRCSLLIVQYIDTTVYSWTGAPCCTSISITSALASTTAATTL